MKIERIKQAVTQMDRKVPLLVALGAVVVAGVITSLPAQDQSSEPDAVRKRLSSATKLVSDDDSDEEKPETQPAEDDDDKASSATKPSTQPGILMSPAVPSTLPATQSALALTTQPTTAPIAGLPQTQPSTSPVAMDSSRNGDNGSRNDRSDRSRGNDRRSDGRSDGRSDRTAPATGPVAADAIVIPPTRQMDKKFDGLLARSIFSKTRPMSAEQVRAINERPSGLSTPPYVSPSPEKNMALRGVSIEDSGDAYAFIEDTASRQIMRIKSGSKVARGTVVEVTLVDMVYDLNGKRMRITTGQTLEGTPAPANTWTTYVPVASVVPQFGSQQQSGDGRDGRGFGRDEGRGGDFGRGGDSGRGGDFGRGSNNGQSPQPGVPVSTPAPAPAPTPGVTPPAAPTTAPSGASEESVLERMRRARQEGGR